MIRNIYIMAAMMGSVGLGMAAPAPTQQTPRTEIGQTSVTPSAATQERNTNGCVPYTPMAQAERNTLPNYRIDRGTVVNQGPGTRQRQRRRNERRTRGGA
jgi:hypothetical protein